MKNECRSMWVVEFKRKAEIGTDKAFYGREIVRIRRFGTVKFHE